jgi:hypothetical protein
METIYDAALDEWRDWTTTATQWLLLNDDYVVDQATHVWVADVVAYEITDASYVRQTVQTPVRTVDNTQHRVTYNCADPDFGDITAEGTLTLCLAKVGTDDSSSLLLASYLLENITTGPLQPMIAPTGVHWVAQG